MEWTAGFARSFLFTPATYPERFGKAAASGADALIVDLEDGVAADRKDDARAAALTFFRIPAVGGPARGLRINSPRTLAGLKDLIGLAESPGRPDFLVVPKCESSGEVEVVDSVLGAAVALVPMIESARGLAEAEAVAEARGRVVGLMFGGADLAAELGTEVAWEPLYWGRGRVVCAAAAAGVYMIDMPWLAADPAGLAAEAARAGRMGFTGKAAIHPDQVATINREFTPTPDQIEWAQRVVEAFGTSGGAPALLAGRLVEEPVVRAARRTLARAARRATP